MCGIIGYIGKEPCSEWIYKGLQKLEYRGYDSSGIVVSDPDGLHVVKAEGKLAHLKPFLSELSPTASVGMGHTRWATHGAPSKANAHPHRTEDLAIIHNGILDNYTELKSELQKKGTTFLSETDTEVILHLLAEQLREVSDLKTAILKTISQMRGAYALGILSTKEPGTIFLVKEGSPMVIGLSEGENYFASDALALLDDTKRFLFLEDGEIAKITPEEVQLWDFEGQPITREIKSLMWQAESATKGVHRHYMVKEIHEQPKVVKRIIDRFINLGTSQFNDENLGISSLDISAIERVHIVGCGTAFLSGCVAQYAIESFVNLPVSVELASEFRYRNPYLDQKTLVIAVTQSGETADTLASVKHAKQRGCQILTICNVMYSSIPRESNATLYMDAGPEIGVASTKAFTAMALSFYILALRLAQAKNTLAPEARKNAMLSLSKLPSQLTQTLEEDGAIDSLATRFTEETNCIFMGRGYSFPIALEGALKLKEISYIHAEGYAGGELKHGPIALIDPKMLVVAICPQDDQHEKMLSNIEEVKARKGRILGVGAPTDKKLQTLSDAGYMPCPQSDDPALQSILSVIPLQLFAYHVACHRGTDVDQPRNLAKSVTVE